MDHPIYLDYAAATPVDPRVTLAMQPYTELLFYNPSATYLKAVEVRHYLEHARSMVALQLGSRPSEIIFTAGGTEADNLAIHGVMRLHPHANVVVSAIEHEAVLSPAAEYTSRVVQPNQSGLVEPSAVAAAIDDDTVLVSVMYANNEVGTVQPIRALGQLVQDIRRDRQARGITTPLYLHTDACQAANYLDLKVARLGVDLMTLNGGKIYGPKQSGVLYVRGGLQLKPLISGGGQERGLRSGTENVSQVVGFAHALEIAQTIRHDESKRTQLLQRQFTELLSKHVPQAVVNGSLKHRLPNNIHITIPGIDNERLLIQLDEVGIMAAAGSACSASNDEPSHVLRALGIPDQLAKSSIRFTMGHSTTSDEVSRVVTELARLVNVA